MEPLDPEGKALKGSALLDLGQNKAALQSYTAASKIAHNENADYLYGKGMCLAKLGRTDESLESLDQALVIEPRHHDALRLKGTELAALGSDEEAIPIFDAELKIEPSSSEMWYLRGEALAHLSREREAIESYDKALDCDEHLVDAWYGKAMCMFKLEQLQEAADGFAHVLKLDPKRADARQYKTSLDKKLKIAAQIEEGENLAAQGEHAEAIKVYNKAGRSDPKNAEVWYQKGISWLELKKTTKAEQSLSKALELNAEHEDAKDVLATIQSKREEQAKFKSQTVADVAAVEEQSRTTEADEKSAESKPEHKDVSQVPAATGVPAVDEQGVVADNLEVQQVVSIGVQDWLKKAHELFRQGEYSQALLFYSKVLDEEPDNADVWTFKGKALEKLGQTYKASQCFETAEELEQELGLSHAPEIRETPVDERVSHLTSDLEKRKKELASDQEIAKWPCRYNVFDQLQAVKDQIQGDRYGNLVLKSSSIEFIDKFKTERSFVIPLNHVTELYKKDTWMGAVHYLRVGIHDLFGEADYIEFMWIQVLGSRSKFIESVKKRQQEYAKIRAEIESLEAELQAFQHKATAEAQPPTRELIDRGSKLAPAYSSQVDVWATKAADLSSSFCYEKAIVYCDKILEIDPHYADAWNNKGISLHKLSRYEEAIACYDKALELDPNNENVLNNKQESLRRLDKR
ncbi:MAG: tetratricopeptide repeat protein [Halobacteriota archaeon]